jgi:phenylacetate-CoA ligase
MIETALAQLSFATSVLFGTPFSLRALDHLLDAMRATFREFGALGSEGAELLQGPALDEATRRHVQLRRFRMQALAVARDTGYYGGLFERIGIDPARMTYGDIRRVPITPKEALREEVGAFVSRAANPVFRTTTTGTTGRPTSTLFSDYEMRLYIALSAIGLLLQGEARLDDVVMISTSSRATLGNTCTMEGTKRTGALVFLGGLVDPAMTLALLSEELRIPGKKRRVSSLITYPSYLGELVECGLRLGYRPSDFGLERISIGGEIVTAGLKRRAADVFGPVQFSEGLGMTETWPCVGRLCEADHLHFEPSHGLVEVCQPGTGEPAAPGEAGSLVVTPFPPYRETTLLLRYDTQDVVRVLAEAAACTLRNLPAVSNVQGKLRLSIQHENGWTYPRAVIEALESVDEVPLPARCGFWAVPGGVAVEALARGERTKAERKIASALAEWGVPLRELHVLAHQSQLTHPYPWRGDLRETSFGLPVEIGAASAREELLVGARR